MSNEEIERRAEAYVDKFGIMGPTLAQAYVAGARGMRDACAYSLVISSSELMLHVGELTANELELCQTLLAFCRARIRDGDTE